MKIIQEQHLKKHNQVWVDIYVYNRGITYENFYKSSLKPPPINEFFHSLETISRETKKIVTCAGKKMCRAVSAFAEEMNKW